METYILLTRLISEETHPSFSLQQKEKNVVDHIEQYCPDVRWLQNYSIFGPWDYVDVFEAPDRETAMKVSAMVRHYGGAHTEIWPATPWQEFKGAMRDLANVMEK